MSLTPFRADLHCHSTFSDGSYSPERLVELALKLNLGGLAITDHDTYDGLKPLEDAAANTPLKVISGAEFSTSFQTISVHLLAYAFNPTSSALTELVKTQEKRRGERVLEIIQLLNKQGIPLTIEEVLEIRGDRGVHAIGRPHIAEALFQKGYMNSREGAFREWLGDQKRAFVRAPSPPIEEVIERIHSAGGVAVLAHPHLLPKRSEAHKLLELPLDGIETMYGRMRHDQNAPWVAEAKRRNWLQTGGSDFHGDHRPDIHLGSSYTNEATFNTLLDLYRKTP